MKEEEFQRILKVSRLKLTEEETRSIKVDIEEIIGYFNKIDKVKTSEDPIYQPIHVPTRLRKDIVSNFPNVEELKKQTKLHDGYILGPKL